MPATGTKRGQDHEGLTNSPRERSTAAVAAVGVDTVSIAYRSDHPDLWSRIEDMTEAGRIEVAPPTRPDGDDRNPGRAIGLWEKSFGSLAVGEPVRSAQWRIFFRHRMLYWEGRLAAILADDPTDHSLADPARLPEAANLAARALERLTRLPDRSLENADQRVRRLDLAADLLFEPRSAGLAFLRTLGALPPARRKVQTWRQGARVETVSFHRPGGGLQLRAYDKGAERRAHGHADAEPPGQRVRIERQHRWGRKAQRRPEDLATDDHAALWLDGMEAWRDHAERLTIAQPDAQAEAILAGAEAGTLSVAEAERLLATVTITRHRGAEWWADQGKPDTGRRRLREAASTGIALDPADDLKPPASVEFGPVIRAVCDAWARP